MRIDGIRLFRLGVMDAKYENGEILANANASRPRVLFAYEKRTSTAESVAVIEAIQIFIKYALNPSTLRPPSPIQSNCANIW